jgi:hypothetical protein
MDLTPRTELDDDAIVEDDELKITSYNTVFSTDGKETDHEIEDKPDAVTESLASVVWDEYLIDVTDHGIKVVPDEPGELDDEGGSDRED